MNVSVVMPWQDGCPHRAAARGWVLRRYRHRHPAWRIRPATLPPGPWVKAAAIAHAIDELEDEDLVVVADADVWSDGLGAAAAAVAAGAPWAVPHRGVHRLSERSTAQVLAGAELAVGFELAERAYPGRPGGGLVVLRASTLRAVPMDSRFVGWGGEDESWALALTCLAGAPWRGGAPLFHLWHPPQPRLTRKVGSTANDRLFRRYRACRRDRAAMRALVAGL